MKGMTNRYVNAFLLSGAALLLGLMIVVPAKELPGQVIQPMIFAMLVLPNQAREPIP